MENVLKKQCKRTKYFPENENHVHKLETIILRDSACVSLQI